MLRVVAGLQLVLARSARHWGAPPSRHVTGLYLLQFGHAKHETEPWPVVTAQQQPRAGLPPQTPVAPVAPAHSDTASTARREAEPPAAALHITVSSTAVPPLAAAASAAATPAETVSVAAEPVVTIEPPADGAEEATTKEESTLPQSSRHARERAVPESALGRLLHFGSLAVNLGVGAVEESVKRSVGRGDPYQSVFVSERNAQVLVDALCKMRGAALKLGQMLSIQDEALVPPQLAAIFDRVRQDADVMPRRQLEKILRAELGVDWQSTVRSFDWTPIAAASIGQVHRVVLRDGTVAAMKVQYPGVAKSIASDVANMTRLLNWTNMLPRGMYLENALDVLSKELELECDYLNEMANQQRMRAMLADDEYFYVPAVVPSHCTTRVLTTELVEGVPLEKLVTLPQAERDHIGRMIMQLCLKEVRNPVNQESIHLRVAGCCFALGC